MCKLSVCSESDCWCIARALRHVVTATGQHTRTWILVFTRLSRCGLVWDVVTGLGGFGGLLVPGGAPRLGGDAGAVQGQFCCERRDLACCQAAPSLDRNPALEVRPLGVLSFGGTWVPGFVFGLESDSRAVQDQLSQLGRSPLP